MKTGYGLLGLLIKSHQGEVGHTFAWATQLRIVTKDRAQGKHDPRDNNMAKIHIIHVAYTLYDGHVTSTMLELMVYNNNNNIITSITKSLVEIEK